MVSLFVMLDSKANFEQSSMLIEYCIKMYSISDGRALTIYVVDVMAALQLSLETVWPLLRR